jgi:hypothetical protein
MPAYVSCAAGFLPANGHVSEQGWFAHKRVVSGHPEPGLSSGATVTCRPDRVVFDGREIGSRRSVRWFFDGEASPFRS